MSKDETQGSLDFSASLSHNSFFISQQTFTCLRNLEGLFVKQERVLVVIPTYCVSFCSTTVKSDSLPLSLSFKIHPHTHPHLGTLTQWSTLLLHSFSAGLSYTFSCSVPMNQTTCWSSQRELDKITRGPLKSIFDPWPPPPFIVGRQQQRTSWLLIALNHGHNYINESSEREIDKVRFKP